MSEESTGEFNLMEAAAELTSEEGTSAESTQETFSEGQAETTPNETENEGMSAKDILEKLGSEKEEEASPELIAQINALGAIHNGMPISVNSPEQLKELLQKGFDYTKKTMAHAEEVRAKQEEFSKIEAQFKEKETALAQKEQQLEQVTYTNSILSSIVAKIQAEDPELFEHLDRLYRMEEDAYHKQMPFKKQFEGEVNSLRQEIQGLKGQKQQEELSSIKQSWEKDLADVQAKQAPALAKLGVKPDWEKVKQAWTADVTNKMTVEEALYAVHGKDIMKANESYQKMLATKNKTQSKLLGRTGVGQGSSSAKETIKVQPGNYEEILRQAMNQL